MKQYLRDDIRKRIREISKNLESAYSVCFKDESDLNEIFRVTLEKSRKEYYVPVGIAFADRILSAREKISALEDEVMKSDLEKGSTELSNLMSSYIISCIKKLINQRKPKKVEKQLVYRPGEGNSRCTNQREVDEAYSFNQDFFKDVKESIKLVMLARSVGIQLEDEELSKNYSDSHLPSRGVSGVIWDLHDTLWREIEDYYAFTTHQKIVQLTDRKEQEEREIDDFMDMLK